MFFLGGRGNLFFLSGVVPQPAAVPKSKAKAKAKAKVKAGPPGAALALKLEGKNLADKKVALRLALSFFNLIGVWPFSFDQGSELKKEISAVQALLLDLQEAENNGDKSIEMPKWITAVTAKLKDLTKFFNRRGLQRFALVLVLFQDPLLPVF